jgi:hypothetical protein
MFKPVRILAVLLMAVLTLTPIAVATSRPAAADDPTAATNDTSVRPGTAWWWYHGVTPSTLNSLVATNHARLTQVKVENPASGPTFSAVMVANSGRYSSAWWWYYGLTAAGVSTTLTTNHSRLVSISPYYTGGQLLFAVVEVPNTGAQARGWEWFYGQSSADVVTDQTAGNWRLTALEPYVVGSTTYYAIILVANTGFDSKAFYYWIGGTGPQIQSTVNQGYRVVSFAVDPSGGFDAILNLGEGEGWWYWYGQSAAQINSHVTADHSRLIDLETYTVSSTRYWASVELDDTPALQAPINAASSTVDTWAGKSGWGGGLHGEFFARIMTTGLAAPAVAANSGFRFEPASAIKILYGLYAMHEVAIGKLSIRSTITYYRSPIDPNNPGVCPQASWAIPANAVHLSLPNALKAMFQQSDNRVTRAFEVLFGANVVNAWAKSTIGLTNTHIYQQFIGCGFNGDVRNDFTLADAGKVYAGIQDGHLIAGTWRTNLLSYMLGGTPNSTSEWGKVVTSIAASLHKSSVVASFLLHMSSRDKGGSYAICDQTCASYHIDLTDAGIVVIPFKVKGSIVLYPYAFGGFVNDLAVPCAPGAGCATEKNAWNVLGNVGAQDAASTIRAALATW